ncbi:MAG: toxic anion resistance protein, partial [Oscillospiraceae bacterium]|nr:toxic anion resistance protein [Oscillospiraceae bacterium]
MSGEYIFDEVITPSLTLEPELEPVVETTLVAQPEKEEAEGPVLTPEEEAMVAAFAEKIDVENTTQILQYGAGTQKKMADFSDAALANVRTQDLGEVGTLIADVVGELKGFDAEEKKGLMGFFRKKADQLETMKNRYAKAEVNVAKIGDALQQHQVRLLKDSAVLDKMYEQNLAYFKELTMYILAGKQKLQQVRSGKLLQLEEKARLSGLAEDAQTARDLADKCNRFEKKIHDLELTRTISIQTAPQIRMIQNNDHVMVEKIQT